MSVFSSTVDVRGVAFFDVFLNKPSSSLSERGAGVFFAIVGAGLLFSMGASSSSSSCFSAEGCGVSSTIEDAFGREGGLEPPGVKAAGLKFNRDYKKE